jgi:hypothetical protein
MGGNDGVIAWGTFTDSSSLLTHFVVGTPTPSSDLSTLAISQTIGMYSLIGSTPVTDSQNNVIGTLNSANMTINFGNSGATTASMAWTLNGSPFTASLSGYTNGSGLFSISGAGSIISSGVNASVALFGPSASRAGMIYNISGIGLDALGAAAFKR